MTIRVAINGFGRTGRAALRASLERDVGITVVAVNDFGSPATMARLLARDSVFGRLASSVKVGDGEMFIDGSLVRVLNITEVPAALPWGELGVDVVIESTGRFLRRDQAAAHLEAGASRVVV